MRCKDSKKNMNAEFLMAFYLFISKKRSNFAVVIELSRHIEILLLSNDCVIVPGLGGFMAHHVSARYDEEEGFFLPPLRTLGFNPQLKMNDSLLAQSYVEAYDISYPEAVRRIEEEVNELTQHINNEGSYELIGIGNLSQNNEGNYIFVPCEAGILSPSLYALPSFEFPMRAGKAVAAPILMPAEEKAEEPSVTPLEMPSDDATEETPQTEYEDEESTDALIIKLSWIRNAAAVAAAVLMFILMTTPISNSESNLAYTNIGTSVIFDTTKKITSPKPAELPKIKRDPAQDSVIAAVLEEYDTTATAKSPETGADKIAENIADKTVEKTVDNKDTAVQETSFCLVLASYVSKKNANAFVERLHKAGFDEAEVYVRNNVTRVVYGKYMSLNDAYNRLNRIKGNKDFEEAWVLKTTDR